MPVATLAEIDRLGRQRYAKSLASKTASAILRESVINKAASYEIDVFLSYSYNDAKLNRYRLLGVKAFLE